MLIATQNGHVEIVQALIGPKADVNQARKDGYTPLRLAIASGNLEIVQALIGANAEVNPEEREDGFTPLILAVEKGNVEIVETLIKAGANVQHQIDHGPPTHTPLRFAIASGNLKIVQALIKAGADVNQTYSTSSTFTPLILAVQKGNVEIVAALIKAGADVNKNPGIWESENYVENRQGMIDYLNTHHGPRYKEQEDILKSSIQRKIAIITEEVELYTQILQTLPDDNSIQSFAEPIKQILNHADFYSLYNAAPDCRNQFSDFVSKREENPQIRLDTLKSIEQKLQSMDEPLTQIRAKLQAQDFTQIIKALHKKSNPLLQVLSNIVQWWYRKKTSPQSWDWLLKSKKGSELEQLFLAKLADQQQGRLAEPEEQPRTLVVSRPVDQSPKASGPVPPASVVTNNTQSPGKEEPPPGPGVPAPTKKK